MNSHIPEWVKPGVWGALIGAVVIAIIGFSAGWVVTTSTAEQTAQRKVDKAVISALTPICVAQFKSVPQAERTTHLAALQKEDSWERSDYVEKQGWATMPGATEPNDEVADACVTELMKVGETSS